MSEETPKFDFSKTARRWSKEWLRVSGEVSQLVALLQSKIKEDAAPTEKADFAMLQADAAARIGGLLDTRDDLVAQVLVSVPTDWLIDAPKDVKPREMLECITDAHYEDLIAAMHEARNNPKN